MGKEIVYCDVCGDRILESEFEKGNAVTLLKKKYCRKCSRTLDKVTATPDVDSSSVKTPLPRKLQLRSLAPADKRDAAPQKPALSMPFIIAIGIGIVVVILLIVVLSRSGPPR